MSPLHAALWSELIDLERHYLEAAGWSLDSELWKHPRKPSARMTQASAVNAQKHEDARTQGAYTPSARKMGHERILARTPKEKP